MQTVPTSRWYDWKYYAVIGACLLIFHFVAYGDEFEQFVNKALQVPNNFQPTEDPPLYFLRQDFVDGICKGSGALLLFVLASLAWSRFRRDSFALLVVSWICLMPDVAKAFVIYWQCPHLLDARKAESPWATFEEYWHAPILDLTMFGTLIFGLAFGLAFRSRFLPKDTNAESDVSAGCQNQMADRVSVS